MRDQPIGRDADQRVRRDRSSADRRRRRRRDCRRASAASTRRYARVRPAPCGRGVDAGDDPQQRRDGEQHGARQIEPKAETQRRRFEGDRRRRNRQQRGRERGNRRQPSKASACGRSPRDSAGRQQHKRRRQRGDERADGRQRMRRRSSRSRRRDRAADLQQVEERVGANPSATAKIASARAIASRLRARGAFSARRQPSAGARTR